MSKQVREDKECAASSTAVEQVECQEQRKRGESRRNEARQDCQARAPIKSRAKTRPRGFHADTTGCDSQVQVRVQPRPQAPSSPAPVSSPAILLCTPTLPDAPKSRLWYCNVSVLSLICMSHSRSNAPSNPGLKCGAQDHPRTGHMGSWN